MKNLLSKPNFKMVVFDMAGTTVDEENLVYHTIHQCLHAENIFCPFETVLKFCAGKEKKDAIRAIVKELLSESNEIVIGKIYASFQENLKYNYQMADIHPMPQAEEVFNALKNKGIKVILNTGYTKEIATYLLKRLEWNVGETIDGLVTASDVTKSRPEPDMIMLAMAQHHISNSSQVIKIGDSIIDIQEGIQAKCGLAIGITTGAHTYDQLKSASPDYIFRNLEELLTIV